MSLEQKFQELLNKRQQQSLYRSLTISRSDQIDFSSNAYLSLGTNPKVQSRFLSLCHSHANENIIGSGGSRLLDGNSQFVEDLEKQIAQYHGSESALIFNSGFDANAGIFSSIAQKGDIIVYDELIHASVHDGMKISRASKKMAFRHNDVTGEYDATAKFQSLSYTLHNLGPDVLGGKHHVFIAVEGIYSMDGDVCHLASIMDCVEQSLPHGNGYIIIDEAHSTGIIGDDGRGLVNKLSLEHKIFIRLHTFGKAMGCAGAAVLCSKITREYLINYARSFIYTTAPPLTTLFAIKSGYDFLAQSDIGPLLSHLSSLMHYTHYRLIHLSRQLKPAQSVFTIIDKYPESPIIPVITSTPRKLAAWCQERGFMVRPIVAPTVPMGKERIRVCLHAENTHEQVDGLVAAIEEWVVGEMMRQEEPIPKL